MGCGPSSAKGRDKYSTLSPDQEPLTPLVAGSSSGRFDDDLNDFITQQEVAASPYIATKETAVKKTREFPVAPGYESHPPPQLPSGYVSAQPNTPSLGLAAQTKANQVHQQQQEDDLDDSAFSEFASLRAGSDLPPKATEPTGFGRTAFLEQPPAVPQESIPSHDSELSTSNKEKKKKKKAKSSKRESKKKNGLMDDDAPEPSSKSGLGFDELYRLKGVLGTGAFSTVREGYHRSSTSMTYAIKCVNRKKLGKADEVALLDEVAILKEMKHIHIIRLYDFFAEPSTYYLVMERMSGGELFDRIVAKAYYNEKEARDVCKIVLEAVGYCHENSVAHRDLKPENLLLLSEDDDSAVKIADFGFAKKVEQPNSLTTQCGTPGYVAPEILEGIPYDTRADMWSVGVILYILLGGYPPFIENNQRDLFRKIRRGEYEFHEEYWGTVSTEAKDLISSLLTVDPEIRLSSTQALENKWIRGDDDTLAKRDLGVNLKALTKFNAKRKFKAAVKVVVAANKLKSMGEDFVRNL